MMNVIGVAAGFAAIDPDRGSCPCRAGVAWPGPGQSSCRPASVVTNRAFGWTFVP